MKKSNSNLKNEQLFLVCEHCEYGVCVTQREFIDFSFLFFSFLFFYFLFFCCRRPDQKCRYCLHKTWDCFITYPGNSIYLCVVCLEYYWGKDDQLVGGRGKVKCKCGIEAKNVRSFLFHDCIPKNQYLKFENPYLKKAPKF